MIGELEGQSFKMDHLLSVNDFIDMSEMIMIKICILGSHRDG